MRHLVLHHCFKPCSGLVFAKTGQFGPNDAERYSWVILHKMNMDIELSKFGRVRQTIFLQFNQLDVFWLFSSGVCRRHVVIAFPITHLTWIQSIDVCICVCFGFSHESTRNVPVS